MDKALEYLAIARKARLLEAGEEPVGAAARAGKACLIVVASDASDHTWRRAQSFAAGTDQQSVRLPYTKAELGQAAGRQELAVAAVTDPAMALAALEAVNDSRFDASAAVLREKAERMRKRRAEAKAHQRNLRRGKKKDRA